MKRSRRPAFSHEAPKTRPLAATAVLAGALAWAAAPGDAAAQGAPGGDAPADTGQAPAVTIVQVPGAPATSTTTTVTPGYPAAGTDINGYLPQSSRGSTDTSRSSDGFDFGPGATGGSVRGSATGAYIVEGQFTPEAHTVRRGDTLWEISELYTKNAYNWPRLWALNPQVQNPHWIYPGDRVRLREAGEASAVRGGVGFAHRRPTVPPETVFLREVGWVDDKKDDAWGQIVGSPDDQMLLSEGDDLYASIEDGHDVTIGQQLTIFRPLHHVETDSAAGELVSIRGTARVDRYNPKTHMVRAKVIESVDVIERGAKLGPVGRRFEVVAPVRNEQDVEARILASLYPHEFYGQNQILFLDKGEKDGLKPGNRLFAVRRGDRWRQSVERAGKYASMRAMVEDDRPAQVEKSDVDADDDLFPDETYAELRIVHVRDHTSAAIVTASTSEVGRNARLVARQGY